MTATVQPSPPAQAAPVRVRRRRLSLFAAAVALAMAVAATAMAGLAASRSADPGLRHEPISGLDAAGPLIAMADLLAPAPGDSTTGRYFHTVIEHWSRADDQIIGFLDISWRGDDGLVHVQQKRTPAHAARSFDSANIGVPGAFDLYPLITDTYGPAEVHSFLERHGVAPSTNPERLARQLDSDNGGPAVTDPCPPTCGRTVEPQVFLDAVIGLYREAYLDRDVRAAVLRAVAELPGLTYLGQVDDRAGRHGIGVFLDHEGVRTTVVFDRDTGVLLASERAVLGFVLDDYSLYYVFERRGGPPPTAPQPNRITQLGPVRTGQCDDVPLARRCLHPSPPRRWSRRHLPVPEPESALDCVT